MELTHAVPPSLYERASARGCAAAHNNLALMHDRGELGLSAAAAMGHHRAALEDGMLNNAVEIADSYWNGKGVPRDRMAAVEWLQRGARPCFFGEKDFQNSVEV